MTYRRDERGQAVVLGAILLFGLFILALAIYQVNLVPQQNRQVEFAAYQEATGSMTDLHDDLVQAAALGGRASVTIETGARYPVRVLGLNPGPVTGSVVAEDAGVIEVTNAVATDSDTSAYWEGTWDPADRAAAGVEFRTDRIVFSPAYNELDVSRIATDGTLTYRIADDGQVLPLTQQTLIRGNHVSLTLIDGAVNVAAADVPLVLEPISSGSESVVVTAADTNGDSAVDENDDPIVIDIPSEIPANVWKDEILDDEPNVEDVRQAGDSVQVLLRAGVSGEPITYRLDVALVEVRERGDDSLAPEGRAAYVVKKGGHNAVITTDQTQDVTVQVRDQYDNPKAGIDVTFTADSMAGALAQTAGEATQISLTVTTGDDGRASVAFAPSPGFSGTTTVSATCGACLTGSQTTDTDIQVSSSRVPNRPPGVEVVDVSRSTDGSGRDTFTVVVRATDPDSDAANDLQSIDLTLRDPNIADSGSTIDFTTKSVSGRDASIPGTTLTAYGGNRAQYRIIATVVDGAGARTSDSFVVSGIGSGATPLTITNVGVTDNANSGKARYEIDVDVQQSSDFGRIEVELRDLDTATVVDTADSTAQRTTYTLAVAGGGGTAGDQFDITIRLFDRDGLIVDQRVVTDTGDGTNPT